MRFLSTRAHGVIDYATGLLLIIAPYVFGFDNGGAAPGRPWSWASPSSASA
jgi:hypothetical protein